MGSQEIHLSFIFLIWACLITLCLSSYDLIVSDQYSILGHDDQLESFLSEEQVVELFQHWKKKHQRVYRLPEEAERRFENFKRNLNFILEKNARKGRSPNGYQLGLNVFADLSNEEFRKIYLSNLEWPEEKESNPMRRRFQSCDAPLNLDWREKDVVTGVKNQGSCGACWAFSTTGAIEGINAIVTGDLISLSEQELVDCVSTNSGCAGGSIRRAYQWVIKNGGIDTEADYPYIAKNGTCNTTKEENKVVTIDNYVFIGRSDADLLCATVQQPISVQISASATDFHLYKSGIYDGDCSGNPNNITHAVLIVGYGSEGDEDYWIVKNSWGTSWGMDGYMYIRRNTNLTYGVCAINAFASYPTKDNQGDYLGVATKKPKMAKHKLPWTEKFEETEKPYHPPQGKRNPLAAMR